MHLLFYNYIIMYTPITDMDLIQPFTKADANRLRELWEDANINDSSTNDERTALIFKRWASRLRVKATDAIIDEKVDDNYEVQAVRQYNGYLKYSA